MDEHSLLDKKRISKRIWAELALILMALIWGSGFVVTKDTLDVLPAGVIVAQRLFIGAFVLSIAFFSRLKGLTWSVFRHGIIVGVFLFLGFYFQTIGLEKTTASKGAFLTAAYVVMVPFFALIVHKGKKLDLKTFLSAILMLFGIFILSFDAQEPLYFSYGDLLVLLCSMFFAMHVVSIDAYTSKGSDPILLCIVQMYVASLLSLFNHIVQGGEVMDFAFNGNFAILYLGVVGSGIAFLIQNVAQKYTSGERAGILMSLESVFGTTLSILLLNEPFNLRIISGCAVIFGAVMLCMLGNEHVQTRKKE